MEIACSESPRFLIRTWIARDLRARIGCRGKQFSANRPIQFYIFKLKTGR